MKRFIYFLTVLIFMACPPPTPDPVEPGKDPEIKVESVTITNKPTDALSFGEKITLAVSVAPEAATNKTVTWNSSDPDIISVIGGELSAGTKAGKALITATSVSNPEAKDSVEVSVTDIPVTVYRDENVYRLMAWFDFETTGLNETPVGETTKVDIATAAGVLTATYKDQENTNGTMYPLDLTKARFGEIDLEEKKPALIEVKAKVNKTAVGSGIGFGIGTSATENDYKGWADEFMNDFDGGVRPRLNNSRGNIYTVDADKYYNFGISFHTGTKFYLDEERFFLGTGNLTPVDKYYLYFGTESGSSTDIVVTVDSVAVYYHDENSAPPKDEIIPATVTVSGKELKLTYFDPFDSREVLEENWDIGNPGIERPEVGNPGPEKAPLTLVEFDDGIKGYENDRYKQPYWSPEAVEIKNGELLIKVYFDPNIVNINEETAGGTQGYIPGSKEISTQGYGVAGAIHSKRQFPSGLFVTKIRHSFGTRSSKTSCHWDAWWAESNNPFSRDYGKKELFSYNTGDETRRGKVFENGEIALQYRGVNGEQVYEYDMYEWVGESEGMTKQYQVLHSWPWYGGYPGWEDRYDSRGGDNNYWSTADNLREHDARGAGFGAVEKPVGDKERQGTTTYDDKGQAQSGDWFYLAMLVTPTEVTMWNFPKTWTVGNFNATPIKKSTTGNQDKAFGNPAAEAPVAYRDADDKSPIQVKYSSELGDWGNKHNLIYNNRNSLTPDNPDVMHAEFFAFYAWDTTGKYKSYTEDQKG